MDFDISFIGMSELQAKLTQLPDTLDSAISAQAQLLAQTLAQNVRDELSGPILQEKTGLLRDSIQSSVESTGDTTSASVFVAGDVPYAAIQEYGGTTKAHIIEATQGKALAFAWAGKQAFFVRVNHPGSQIPEHDYMSSALADMQDDILTGFADALGDALAG